MTLLIDTGMEMIMILGNEQKREKGLVISVDFSERAQRQQHKKDDTQLELEQAMRANRRNQERMRKQRATANKSVLRTYRIKKNEKK